MKTAKFLLLICLSSPSGFCNELINGEKYVGAEPYHGRVTTAVCRYLASLVREKRPLSSLEHPVTENHAELEKALSQVRISAFDHVGQLDGQSYPDLYVPKTGPAYVHKKNVTKLGRLANEAAEEWHAYQSDKLFDLKVVPPTVLNREGQVLQLFIPRLGGEKTPGQIPPERERDYRRIRFLGSVLFKGYETGEPFVDETGKAWVVDFGLAKRVDPRTDPIPQDAVLRSMRDPDLERKLSEVVEEIGADVAGLTDRQISDKYYGALGANSKRSLMEWQIYLSKVKAAFDRL